MVSLPPSLESDVHHGEWTGSSLLHRSILHAWLRQLYFGQCHAADHAGDMERRKVPGIPARIAEPATAAGLLQLWAALEPLIWAYKGFR